MTILEPAHRSADRERVFALGAGLLAVTLWASAFVGIRSAGHELSPGSIALGRLLVGSAALGAIVLARREPLPGRRDLPAIAFCGIFWFGIYNVALNEAERRVDAGTAAMLVNIGPILIAVLAGIMLREGFPPKLLAGCARRLLGDGRDRARDIGRRGRSELGRRSLRGRAFAYSAAIVVQKPVLARVSGLQVTWLACAVGALVCLPFAPTLIHEGSDASASAISWTIYLGAAPTAIGFVAWAYALARTSAGRLGSTTYLAAPIAICSAGRCSASTAVAGAPGRNPVPRRSRDCPAHRR